MSLTIAGLLCELGYEVCFLSYHAQNDYPVFPVHDGISYEVIFKNSLSRRLRYKAWYKRWKVRRFLQKKRIDVAIDVDLFLSYFTAPAVRGTKIRHIAWENYCFEHSAGGQYWDGIRMLLDNGGLLVTLTQRDRQLYLNQFPFAPLDVCHIYNPVSFSVPCVQQHTANRVICVSRFSAEKGLDRLLDVWKMVESVWTDWTLDIYGDDGKDEIGLHQYQEELGLKTVCLHPITSEVQRKMAESSICVLTSRQEGLGLTLLEACVSSLPMVAFDCPNGPREIIVDGQNGYLVPDGDIALFANRLLSLMDDPDERARMGANAYETSKQFSQQAIIRKWVELIERDDRESIRQ